MTVLTIALVPHGCIHEVLPSVLPFFKKAEPWTLGRQSVDDLVTAGCSERVQLWVLFDVERVIRGYIMTEIRQYPRKKHLCVLNIGGTDGYLESCVQESMDVLERFAVDNKCEGMEIVGRPAWSKFLQQRNYERPYVQYYKNLKEPS